MPFEKALYKKDSTKTKNGSNKKRPGWSFPLGGEESSIDSVFRTKQQHLSLRLPHRGNRNNRGDSPSPNFLDAFHTQRILSGILRSSKTGMRIEL